MDDNSIIGLYEERNEKAISETDKKYGKFCKSIAYNILFNEQDCEEALNDTYLKTWNSIPPQKPKILSSFLGKITRSISIDKLRKRTAEKRGGGEYNLALSELDNCIPSKNSTPENNIEAGLLTEILNGFLEGLAPDERKIFVCRYWYFDSVRSISSQFGYSESKIKSMLFRTRNRLREILEKEGYVL